MSWKENVLFWRVRSEHSANEWGQKQFCMHSVDFIFTHRCTFKLCASVHYAYWFLTVPSFLPYDLSLEISDQRLQIILAHKCKPVCSKNLCLPAYGSSCKLFQKDNILTIKKMLHLRKVITSEYFSQQSTKFRYSK